MRWPFRRKGAQPGTDTADSTVDSARTPVRRPGRQWANLPPLPVTVAPTAPLVMGPAPVLAPLPGPRLVFGPPVMPRTGRVDGLARAVPTSPEPPALVDPPVPAPEPPAPVARPVHSRPPEPPAPLTEAAPQYVGEPREPAEPYRAPGWLRYTPDWLKQQSAAADPLGLPVSTPEPVHEAPPKPRPVLPPRIAESPQQTEPEVVEGETSGAPVDLPPRPRRRPNLGQTRRLGLGAPLKRAPEQELVPPPIAAAPVEPVQEPPPASEPAPAAEEAGGDEPPRPQPPPQPPPRAIEPPPTGPATEPTRPAAVQSEPAPTKVPLVYRSAPGRREPAPRGTTQVPAGLAEAIRSRHGVDVADVPVHRTPAAATEARSLGARAFTRNAEVYLPEDAGPLDSPKAKGLLAHELVHVAQQRSLGPALPESSTPEGAALEADAVAAEHEQGGHGHAPPPELVHPSLTQVLGQAARTAGVQLAPLVPEVSHAVAPEMTSAMPAAPPEITSLSEPVRQDVGQISEASAARVIQQWTNPALGGSGFTIGEEVPLPASPAVASPSIPDIEPAAVPLPSVPVLGQTDSVAESEMANQVLQVVNLDRATKGEPGLSALDESTMEQVRQAIAEQLAASNARAMMFASAAAQSTEPPIPTGTTTAAATPGVQDGQLAAGTEQLPLPAPTPEPAPTRAEEDSALRDGQLDLEKVDLEELSTKLYDRLRSRLRMELLIDRERAGLLTDFR